MSTVPASVKEHYRRSFKSNCFQAEAVLCPPLPPGDIWHSLKMSFWLPHNDSWERGVVLASSGERPRMLLLSSPCAQGRSHTEKGKDPKVVLEKKETLHMGNKHHLITHNAGPFLDVSSHTHHSCIVHGFFVVLHMLCMCALCMLA